MNTKKKWLLICVILTAIIGVLSFFIIKELSKPKNVIIDTQTIMMSSTKSKEKSEFDIWLTDELGVKWVPSYLVVDGYDIIGIIDGGFGLDSFKENYKTIIDGHNVLANFREIDFDDVYFPFKETTANLVDLLKPNQITLIEVHRIDCKDCEIADGVPGEYKQYVDFDEDGKPIEDTAITLKLAGTEYNETSQVRNALKNVVFYRYYIKSSTEKIFERYR